MSYSSARRLLVLFLLAAAIPAALAQNAVLRWNEFLLETIQRTGTNPPLATRLLAMTHTAMFDAWAAYDDRAVGTRLGTSLRRPPAGRTQANKEIAIGFAAYSVMLDLYPDRQATLDSFMGSLGLNPADVASDPTGPVGIGRTAAQAVLDFRHRDGSNQLGDLHAGAYSDYTGFEPVNGPGTLTDPDHWQPLTAASGAVQQWLLPHWGRVKGFALQSGSQFRPGPQARHGNDLYQQRCDDLLRASAELTDRQKMIAEYWEDGAGTVTPPGHWNRIASFVSKRDSNDLDRDVKLFFALTNAQFDAGIGAWDTKRFYDSVRPVSAIRKLYAGKMVLAWAGPRRGTQLLRGEEWQPYLATPPFAEYISGHSTFSTASAEVLRLFTGSDDYDAATVFEPGSSRIESGFTPRGTVRLYWATFSDAADEAGYSRRLGGIHFEEGDLRARTMGRQIGLQAFSKAFEYFEGVGATDIQ